MTRRAVSSTNGEFKGSSDPYRTVLFVLLVITISRIHQHFAFLRPVRPALTLVLLALIYAYLNPKYLASGSIFSTWAAKVVAAIGLMACLSVPLSISTGGSATFILFEFSKVLLFAFLLIAGMRNARDLYRLVWGYVIASGFLAYLSLFVFRLKPAGGDFVRIQNAYTYDSNDLGLVAIVGVALTLLVIQVPVEKRSCLVLSY